MKLHKLEKLDEVAKVTTKSAVVWFSAILAPPLNANAGKHFLKTIIWKPGQNNKRCFCHTFPDLLQHSLQSNMRNSKLSLSGWQ